MRAQPKLNLAAENASPTSVTAKPDSSQPWAREGRWCVVAHVISTMTPMLLAAMACTANSGRLRSACSEQNQATTPSAIPASYDLLVVTFKTLAP